MSIIRTQQIRARLDKDIVRTLPAKGPIHIGGKLTANGRGSYLRIADKDDRFLGSIGGQKLYRLAKAVIRRYEAR